MSDKTEKYFQCTDSERAVFEAGIKLGMIVHQYTDVPLSRESVSSLEKAIEKSVLNQPYVKSAKIKISRDKLNTKNKLFNYTVLTEDMLTCKVTIQYKNVIAVAVLKYISELDYPLMYVEKVKCKR